MARHDPGHKSGDKEGQFIALGLTAISQGRGLVGVACPVVTLGAEATRKTA